MNNSVEALAATLDKDKYIRYDPDGYLLAWNGSLQVNIYKVTSIGWQEIDVFTMEPFDHGDWRTNLAHVDAAMMEWMETDANANG